jgi:multiple sugar transport system substrate-binding protein
MTRTIILAVALATLVAGCGSGSSDGAKGGPVTIRYALWDTNQAPVYQKCADAFHKQNPNISIKIENTNWNDYWPGLARSFVADTAPDVFTDHLGKYPQFAVSDVIVPLNRYIERDNVDTKQYLPGLADLWRTPGGKQFGLPKDWDTVAVISNGQMLQKAGVTKDELDHATWDPKTGGTFEKIAAKLSVDKNGKRGDEPGFDPKNVAVYGLALDPGSLTYGQTTWSGLARSTGFELLDKDPWGTKYHYDDPRFIQTFEWWRHMIVKGYMPPLEQARTLGQQAAFQGQKVALAIDGDWTISTYTQTKGVKVGFSPQPAGPKGSWSMYNGLADSIWKGSKHKAEAWQWVKFLSSPTCENIVGTGHVVFPAIPSGVRRAVAEHKKDGVDVSAFTSYLKTKNTLLYPITDKAPQINLIVQPTLENVLLGSVSAKEAIPKMNDQVNNQLKFK